MNDEDEWDEWSGCRVYEMVEAGVQLITLNVCSLRARFIKTMCSIQHKFFNNEFSLQGICCVEPSARVHRIRKRTGVSIIIKGHDRHLIAARIRNAVR